MRRGVTGREAQYPSPGTRHSRSTLRPSFSHGKETVCVEKELYKKSFEELRQICSEPENVARIGAYLIMDGDESICNSDSDCEVGVCDFDPIVRVAKRCICKNPQKHDDGLYGMTNDPDFGGVLDLLNTTNGEAGLNNETLLRKNDNCGLHNSSGRAILPPDPDSRARKAHKFIELIHKEVQQTKPPSVIDSFLKGLQGLTEKVHGMHQNLIDDFPARSWTGKV